MVVTNNLFQFPTTNYMASLFKAIPHKYNTISHLCLPRFYTLLEEFFWDAPQLRCYSSLDDFIIKMGLLDNPLELQDQVNREAVSIELEENRKLSESGDCSCAAMFISVRNCQMLSSL